MVFEKQLVNCGCNVLELLRFLEKIEYTDPLGELLPFIDIKVLQKKDTLKDFLKLNYNGFFESVQNRRGLFPLYLVEFFTFCSKDEGVEFLTLLIQKDILTFHMKQITTGEENDNSQERSDEIRVP